MQQKGIISVEVCQKRQQPLKRDFADILHSGVSFVRIPVTSLNKNKSVNLCEPIICLNTHTLSLSLYRRVLYKILSEIQIVSEDCFAGISFFIYVFISLVPASCGRGGWSCSFACSTDTVSGLCVNGRIYFDAL